MGKRLFLVGLAAAGCGLVWWLGTSSGRRACGMDALAERTWTGAVGRATREYLVVPPAPRAPRTAPALDGSMVVYPAGAGSPADGRRPNP